jgi:AcrR family transcriptional regulator
MGPRARATDSRQKKVSPSAQKLLDTTVELLETTPIEQVLLADVLERSGVSNGSLYHHFEDFRDLVEQAVVVRFTQGLNDSLAAIAQLLDSADAVEFRQRTENTIRLFHAQNRRPFRMARFETLGVLPNHPRLAALIGAAQHEATMKQAEYFAEFQRRGWFRDDFDSAAVSAFLTATFLGRVADDISDEPVDPDAWTTVAMAAFRAILFPD